MMVHLKALHGPDQTVLGTDMHAGPTNEMRESRSSIYIVARSSNPSLEYLEKSDQDLVLL